MKGGFDSDYENVSEGKKPQPIDNTLAKTLFYQNFHKQDKKHNIFEKVEEKHSEMLDESKIKDLDKS